MSIEKMRQKLKELCQEERFVCERRQLLQRQIQTLCSQNFIRDNSITLKDVQVSSGDNIPYHGDRTQYGKWLKANNITKPYCEWNGWLYMTCDIIADTPTQTPAQIEDVPKA